MSEIDTVVAAQRTGGPPLRLHYSENPHGACSSALAAAHARLEDINRYPDPAKSAVVSAIARHCDTAPDQVAVGNGVDELILLLALASAGGRGPAVLTANTFTSYLAAVRAVRLPFLLCPLADYRVPADALTDHLRAGAGLAFVCNPHNPTGSVLEPDELARLAAAAEHGTGMLVVDEAYAEYAGAQFVSMLPSACTSRHVCVLRTLSKAHGLAALRIGYAIGPSSLMAEVRRLQTAIPFSVNQMAQSAAVAALDDRDFVRHTTAANHQVRAEFCAGLEKLGVWYLPSHTNFVLIRPPTPAARFADALVTGGVLVRHTGDMGLPDHIRVSMGTAAQMRHALALMADLLNSIHRGETHVD